MELEMKECLCAPCLIVERELEIIIISPFCVGIVLYFDKTSSIIVFAGVADLGLHYS